MSLFKARDWWATRVGDDEVFDFGCMAVGNIDNASTPSGNNPVLQWKYG